MASSDTAARIENRLVLLTVDPLVTIARIISGSYATRPTTFAGGSRRRVRRDPDHLPARGPPRLRVLVVFSSR
jgi:hypothetical protein